MHLSQELMPSNATDGTFQSMHTDYGDQVTDHMKAGASQDKQCPLEQQGRH